MCRTALRNLSVQQKLELIYAMLDDLSAELLDRYQDVTVDFQVHASGRLV